MLAMADIDESSSSSSSNSNAPGLFKLFGKTITVEDQKDKPSNSNNINEETSKEGIAAGGALPCPRCKSKDTKFCYFNNYNVNQPRHFCRSCHRYWTAGGTLRNVPKGAGRRKTRSSPGTTSPVKLSLLHES